MGQCQSYVIELTLGLILMLYFFWTSNPLKNNPTDLTYTGLPAEFKHISKQRKRY